jgi:hypothetical protein
MRRRVRDWALWGAGRQVTGHLARGAAQGSVDSGQEVVGAVKTRRGLAGRVFKTARGRQGVGSPPRLDALSTFRVPPTAALVTIEA